MNLTPHLSGLICFTRAPMWRRVCVWLCIQMVPQPSCWLHWRHSGRPVNPDPQTGSGLPPWSWASVKVLRSHHFIPAYYINHPSWAPVTEPDYHHHTAPLSRNCVWQLTAPRSYWAEWILHTDLWILPDLCVHWVTDWVKLMQSENKYKSVLRD